VRDPSRVTIRFTHQLDREGERVELRTDESKATLPLPPATVRMLLEHKARARARSAAVAAPRDALGSDLWLRLAENSERDRPADALAVYQRIADEVLERADRRAYRSAARILERARAAAQAASSTRSVTTSPACASNTGDGRP